MIPNEPVEELINVALTTFPEIDGMGFGGDLRVGEHKYHYQFSFTRLLDIEPLAISGPVVVPNPQEGGYV